MIGAGGYRFAQKLYAKGPRRYLSEALFYVIRSASGVRFCEVSQHIMQHATIFDVFDLDFRIDPALDLDRLGGAVRIGDVAWDIA